MYFIIQNCRSLKEAFDSLLFHCCTLFWRNVVLFILSKLFSTNKWFVFEEIKSTAQEGCKDTPRINYSVCVMLVSFHDHSKINSFSHGFSWTCLESVPTFNFSQCRTGSVVIWLFRWKVFIAKHSPPQELHFMLSPTCRHSSDHLVWVNNLQVSWLWLVKWPSVKQTFPPGKRIFVDEALHQFIVS